MCAHRYLRLNDSYWSKRRRVHASVQSHIADLQSNDSTEDRVNIIYSSDSSLLSSSESECIHTDAALENCANDDVLDVGSATGGDERMVNDDLDIWSKYGSSDSDGSSDLDESDLEHCDELLQSNLIKWVGEFNISHAAVGKLLHILHPHHPGLPMDSRTLLNTPRSSTMSVSNVAGGVYHYIGIKTCLERLHQCGVLTVTSNIRISIQINIDGLPLFKSSGMQLWPILGYIKNPDVTQSEPFVIGIFAGLSKPTSAAEYLSDFVAEATSLQIRGFLLSDVPVFVDLHSIVCDAPARAFLKNIKSFTGYHGCERCIQPGRYYCGRMTFPDSNSNLRTDESFIDMADEDHHLSDVPSPLTQLSVGMVSCFVLDYMHLVCLGVVRRLLLLWVRGPLPIRLSAGAVSQLNKNLLSLHSCTPCEFSRKPRSVVDIDRWKATEFRQFLLFTGPLALRDMLPQELYKNFLLLHVAIVCLVHPYYCKVYCDFAQKLLVKFVKHCHDIYGQQFIVYNVHSLIHVADDVKHFGPLDSISCFPFENFLHSVKRLVRSPYLPLQQVVNRVYEHHCCLFTAKRRSDSPILKHVVQSDFTVTEFDNAKFYFRVETKLYNLCTRDSDNCVWLKDGKIGRIQYIMHKDDTIILLIQLFETVNSFYIYPLDSQTLDIVCVKNLSPNKCTYLLADIKQKCMCMPMTNDSFVAVPLSS